MVVSRILSKFIVKLIIMETKIRWKKKLMSSTYELFSGDRNIGKLTISSWGQSATGVINGRTLHIKTKGFINQVTEISGESDTDILGKIIYNTWKTKAVIDYVSGKADCKCENFWNTKWTVFDDNGTLISYASSRTTGEIDVNKYDEILIMSGLQIINFFLQTSTVVMMTALLPIWVSMF